MRLGLARENHGQFAREIGSAIRVVADELGWSVIAVDDAAGEAQSDVVLAVGNLIVYPDLLRRPRVARRVLWYVEPVYGPHLWRGPFHRYLPSGRILDVFGRVAPPVARTNRYRTARENAAIVREPLANLAWLKRGHAAFDVIASDSRDRVTSAAHYGLKLQHVPLGYGESYAGPLVTSSNRAIPVLFMGHMVGKVGRRQRLLETVRQGLGSRGVQVTLVTSDLYGEKRQETLASTRVVMDLHRIAGNFNAHRFVTATAAGAVLISEPLADPAPLVPGVHYVESRAEEMADEIAALLDEEDRRLRIVDAAQQLLRTEMSMRTALSRLVGPYVTP